MDIPAVELARLDEAIRDAHQLADRGQAQAGYEVLDLMLSWAENPEIDLDTGIVAAPEPWAAELSDRYRAAIVAYGARLRSPGSKPAEEPPPVEERIELLRIRIEELCRRSRQLRGHSTSLLVRSRGLRKRLPQE